MYAIPLVYSDVMYAVCDKAAGKELKHSNKAEHH